MCLAYQSDFEWGIGVTRVRAMQACQMHASLVTCMQAPRGACASPLCLYNASVCWRRPQADMSLPGVLCVCVCALRVCVCVCVCVCVYNTMAAYQSDLQWRVLQVVTLLLCLT